MIRSIPLLLLACLVLLWPGAAPVAAQGTGAFLISVTEGNDSRIVQNGQLTQFRSVLGRTAQITINITYNGTTRGELGFVSLVGSQDFRFSTAPDVPAVLVPGQRATFSIEFTPTSSRSILSQFAIPARELPPADSNLAPGNFGLVFLGLLGTVPDVQFAYALRVDSNVLPVASGGTAAFQPTTINTQDFLSFFIFNQGLAFSEVESIRLEGDSSFQIFELPLLPTNLDANSSLRIQIRYFPREAGSHRATLTVVADGVTSVISITGTSQGPAWVYELIPSSGDDPVVSFEPDSTVTLPDTDLNRRTTVWVRVSNAGNFDGEIAGINILGQGLSLLDLPFTPLIVKPGRNVTFAIVFLAQQPGRVTGRLRIGQDFFNLAANAVGPQLEFSFTSASANLPLLSGGQVVLPSTAVGQTTMALFRVENTGNQAATVPSISLSGGLSAYSLDALPAFPLILEPEERVEFRIVFRPTQPGPNTDILAVGTAFFNLTGSAAALPPLPSYRFEGPSGTVQPLQQPGIGLTLSEPYPVTLRGSLSIIADSTSFGSDPAVQFATGGRVVNFTIPANTTRAVFPTNSTSLRIQTGSAAGAIILTPAFATETGIDRTPADPSVLTLVVPELAPQLVDLRMEITSGGVVFIITGYTTPRNLTKVDLTIQRDKADDATFSFDVTANSTIWFNTTGSQGFGGLFSASVPFRITGSPDDVADLIDEIKSATAIVTNRTGASQPITANIK